MKFLPFYFFIALFIGFMIIYMFETDYHLIVKNKENKVCYGNYCPTQNTN